VSDRWVRQQVAWMLLDVDDEELCWWFWVLASHWMTGYHGA